MNVVGRDDVKTLQLPGRDIRFIATPATCGLRHMNGGITAIHAGSQLPLHSHRVEEEMMHFLQGQGEAVLDSEIVPVAPGDTFCVPAGGSHTVRNTGVESLVFFFVFSPPVDTAPYEAQSGTQE